MAATLSTEDMTAALNYGAALDDRPTLLAAIHLLVFTDLPGRADFARFVDIEPVENREGVEQLAAFPKWHKLADAVAEFRLDGAKDRLLQLAVSYATGKPVDLREVTGLGTAHAKAAIEAAIIAQGMTGFYQLNDGPELERMRAFHANLLGED